MTGGALTIVDDVCRRFAITPGALRGRERNVVLLMAREEAAARLHWQAGLSLKRTAALLCRNDTTIKYWLLPGYRKHRQVARREASRVWRQAKRNKQRPMGDKDPAHVVGW